MILFLNGEYPFCYYYRGYLPGIYSKQMVVTDFITHLDKADQTRINEQIQRAEIIVLQRPKDQKVLDLVYKLKSLGKKVIFENDDTYLYGKGIDPSMLENDAQREIAKQMSDTTNKILKLCDGAIASTPILAKEYGETNPNVCVLKNCIDPLDEFKCKPNDTGKFRIGFIGSVTTNDDYIHIKDAIMRLDERNDVTIVVMGVKYKDGTFAKFMEKDHEFWSTLKNIEWHSYVKVTEYMMTLSKLKLDIAIIPRKESYFNKCKSNLKFLEMSLLRIPVIAQGFEDSPYEQDKDYLTLVYNNDNWYNEIIKSKDNYSEYKSKANNAHDYVLENYNIKNYAQEWVKQIYNLCK